MTPNPWVSSFSSPLPCVGGRRTRGASEIALDFIPTTDYIPIHPALATEGRLIKRLLTRGGWRWPVGGVGDAAPVSPPGGPSRLVPARQPRVAGPRDGGAGNRSQACRTRPGPIAVDRRPSNSRGEAGRLKREVHRGRDGANLKTPRAGRHGNGGFAAIRTSAHLDAARCRGPRIR